MPGKTTPKRLREIIDRFAVANTFEQQKAIIYTLTPDELLDYEEYLRKITTPIKPPTPAEKEPDKKFVPQTGAGISFAQWVEERKQLTEDEIFDIEAETQGLKLAAAPQKYQPATESGKAFAQWVEERKQLTEDEIFDIEAETQGLKEMTAERILTLAAREDAERKALAEVIKPTIPPQVQPTVKPDLIIKRTPYPKWWNDEGIAKISLTSPGSQLVIHARGDYSLYIATIVLTVTGECAITFAFGEAGSGGAMSFGGEGQPMGIVIATGNSPIPCGSGTFMITATSDDAVTIGGFVSYYLWKKETP